MLHTGGDHIYELTSKFAKRDDQESSVSMHTPSLTPTKAMANDLSRSATPGAVKSGVVLGVMDQKNGPRTGSGSLIINLATTESSG